MGNITTTVLSVLCHSLEYTRYFRFLFDMVQYYGYFRLHPPTRYSSNQEIPNTGQFTVINLTLGLVQDFSANIQSWLACKPRELIIVTINEQLANVQHELETVVDHRIRYFSLQSPNWRKQACIALPHVSTPYVVFVDDRVRWSPLVLQQMAVAFSHPAVGGVTTLSQVTSTQANFTTWESFGALNIVRRNILHSFLAYFLDGSVLNLAGRTSGYRTKIIQREDFYHNIQNDYWRGKVLLQTGDDNFMTSWVTRQGWRTRFLNDETAMIVARVNADWSYLKQLMRWSRDTARCYIRDLKYAIEMGKMSLFVESISKILANYASDFAVAGEVGVILVITISRQFSEKTPIAQTYLPSTRDLCLSHIGSTSILQILEHGPFFTDLRNLVYLPSTVLYAYIHAIIVIVAIMSLNQSVWDSNPGAVLRKS